MNENTSFTEASVSGLHAADCGDPHAALLAATEAATSGDKGLPIATAVIAAFRERKARPSAAPKAHR